MQTEFRHAKSSKMLAIVTVALAFLLLPVGGQVGAQTATGGTQVWEWTYDGGFHGLDRVRDVATSPSGDVVYTSGSVNMGGFNYDYLTLAQDALTGVTLWEGRYDGGSGDFGYGVAASPLGDKVFVTGYSGPCCADDIATVAHDALSGENVWEARYNGMDGADFGWDIATDGERVFVIGQSESGSYSYDYVTIAYDAETGTQLWEARYDGGGSGATDRPAAIALTEDDVVVTGISSGDAVTVAYDKETGAERWLARYTGGSSWDGGYDLAVAGDSIYVTGAFLDDFITIAYDAGTGAQRWVTFHDGPGGSDSASGVVADEDAVYVTGWSMGIGTDSDFATVAYDAADGTQIWAERHDGPAAGRDYPRGIALEGDRVYVTGPHRDGGNTFDDNDFATLAYDTASGAEVWLATYNGAVSENDISSALVVNPDGLRIHVGGWVQSGETHIDYATVTYLPDEQALPAAVTDLVGETLPS